MESKKLLLQYLNKEKTIYYNNKMVVLTDEIHEEVKLLLPSYWHTNTDSLELFEFYTDGTYFCERKKESYDYRSKTVGSKYYTYLHSSNEQASELYDILCDVYEKSRILYLQTIKEDIKKQISLATGVIKSNIEYTRIKLLNQSDWSMLPDVEHSEGEKDMWIAYRKYLRDMSSTDEWDLNPLSLKIPLDPKVYKVYYPGKESEYLTKEEHFNNPIASKIKQKLMRFVKYICMPTLRDINYTEDSIESIRQTIQDSLYKIDASLEVPEVMFQNYDNADEFYDNQSQSDADALELLNNIETG